VDDDITVLIAPSRDSGGNQLLVHFIATIRTTPPKDVEEILFNPPPITRTDKEGNFQGINSSEDGISNFPESFKKFTHEIGQRLNQSINNTIKRFCWRHAIFGGPHIVEFNPIGLRWGNDEDENDRQFGYLANQWPSEIVALGDIYDPLFNLRPKKPKTLPPKNAPLHFEILNEALSIFDTRPRSALIMLVAALETAIKQYVSKAAPEAAWPIEKVPSPPIEKLYFEYLPLLPILCKNEKKCPTPPKKIKAIIKDAVEERNNIVHGRPMKQSHEFLINIREATISVLYFIDVLCGESWASTYLPKEFEAEVRCLDISNNKNAPN